MIALLDSSGSVVARYEYGAWGDIRSITDGSGAAVTSSTHIANINPLRYRGYYYDAETGFYYLQSRYYDPVIKRFINADAAEYSALSALSLYDTNLFAYCGNNPVNRSDPNGTAWQTALAVGATIAVVGLLLLATIATGGGVLALAGAASAAAAAATATAVANTTVAAGLVIAGGSLLYAASSSVSRPGTMQREVEKNQAPREVKQVHSAHVDGQKPHVHFKNGTSINYDGTIHDKMGGIPKISKVVGKWLGKHGWSQIVK